MKFNWKQALLVGTAILASGGGVLPVSKAFAQAELIIDVNNDGTFTADGTEQFDQPINLTTTGSQDGGNNEANDRDILVNGSATIGIDADTNIGAAPGAGTQLTSGAIFTAAGAGGSTLILLNSGGSGDAETLTVRGDILRFTSNNIDQGSLNLTINGQSTGAAGDDFNVDVQGSIDLGTGVLRVSDNGGAGAVLLEVEGDVIATGGIILDSSVGGGGASLMFASDVLQTVTGAINGAADGEGILLVSNSGGVVFASDIGTTSYLDRIVLGSGLSGVRVDTVTFNGDVATMDLSLGDANNANGENHNLIFNTGNSGNVNLLSANIAGAAGGAADDAIITISGSGTLRFASGSLVDNDGVFSVLLNSGTTLDLEADVDIGGNIVLGSGAGGAGTLEIGPGRTINANNIDNLTNSSAGTLIFDNTGGNIDVNLTGGIGTTSALNLITFRSNAGLVDISAPVVKVETINLNSGGNAIISGNVTADSILMDNGAILAQSTGDWVIGTITLNSNTTFTQHAGNFTGNITGDAGVQTVRFAGGNAGIGAGNVVNLGSGNDNVFLGSGATITFASGLIGGGGTDTINLISNGTINTAVSQFETISLQNGTLEFGNNASISDTPTLVFANADTTLTVNTVNTTLLFETITGSGGTDTITFVSGGLEVSQGNTINLAGGDDVITIAGGRLGRIGGGNTLELGAGSDVINLNGGVLYASVSNSGAERDVIIVGGQASIRNAVGGNTVLMLSGGANLTIDMSDENIARNDFDINIFDTTVGAERLTITSTTMDGTISLGSAGGTDLLFTSASTFNGAVSGGGTAQATFTGGSNTINDDFVNFASTTVNLGATVTFLDNTPYTLGDLDVNGTGRIILGSQTTLVVTDLDNSGTIEFQVAGDDGSDNLNVGQIQLPNTGAVTLSSALTVEFTGSVTLGSAIVFTSAGGTANDVPKVEDNFLFDFTLTNDGGNIKLTVSNNNDLAAIGSTATAGVGAVLQPLLSNPNSDRDFLDFAALISQAGRSTEQIQEDLESVAPTVDGSASVTIANSMGKSADLISTRLAAIRRKSPVTGMSAGNVTQGIKVWTQALGATGEQDTRGSVDGYSFDTYGMAAGIDTQALAEDFTLGVALSYANTQSDSFNSNRTETETDTYLVTLYMDYQYDSGTYLSTQFAYGQSDINRKRYNVGGVATRIASAEYDSDQLSANFEYGHDYVMENGIIVTPYFTGRYQQVATDDFAEVGGGAFSLEESPDSNSTLEAGLGLEISGQMQQDDGDYIKPEMDFGYRYEFFQDEVETTANFTGGGGSFVSTGPEPEPHRFNVGAGLTYISTTNWELQTHYNYDWREDFDSHSGFVRAAYKF